MKTNPETNDKESKIKFEGFEFKPDQIYFWADRGSSEGASYYTYDELVKEKFFTPDPENPLSVTENHRLGKTQRDLRQECRYISDPVLIRSCLKIRQMFFAVRNTNAIEGRSIHTVINGLKVQIWFGGIAGDTKMINFQVMAEDQTSHLKVRRSYNLNASRINALEPGTWFNDTPGDNFDKLAVDTLPQEVYSRLENNLNLKEILKIIEEHLNAVSSELPQEKIVEIRKRMGLDIH